MCAGCRETLLPAAERKPAEIARLGLHAHNCAECGLLRTCYQNPCPHRGRGDNSRDSRHAGGLKPWICFVCVDAAREAAEKEKAA